MTRNVVSQLWLNVYHYLRRGQSIINYVHVISGNFWNNNVQTQQWRKEKFPRSITRATLSFRVSLLQFPDQRKRFWAGDSGLGRRRGGGESASTAWALPAGRGCVGAVAPACLVFTFMAWRSHGPSVCSWSSDAIFPAMFILWSPRILRLIIWR